MDTTKTILNKTVISDEMAFELLRKIDENGNSFTEEVTEFLNCIYSISSKMKDCIPTEGRILFWTRASYIQTENLSLLNLVSDIRDDVSILSMDPVFDMIKDHEKIRSFTFINHSSSDDYLNQLEEAFQREDAVIICNPALSKNDLIKWTRKIIQLAKRKEVPIVPVSFEIASGLKSDKSSDILKQSQKNNKKEIRINLGGMIPFESYSNLKTRVAAKLFVSHQKQIHKGRSGNFQTISSVTRPIDSKKLRKEIFSGETLGFTEDNKVILLFDYNTSPNVMQEISRLREVTFRKIGEGTGRKRDTDRYDKYYNHLVLWDDAQMEIVGAYRLGLCNKILLKYGPEGLYSNSLFGYSPEFVDQLSHAVECGRSFVQEKYWNSLALDYLWHGIGALLARRPEIKYLFGPVSISKSYSKAAREHLIFFYLKYFRAKRPDVKSRKPYLLSRSQESILSAQYPGVNYNIEFRLLKKNLKNLGFAVPTLYKQYTELCEPGGVQFYDFGVDPDFSNCIDGFINVDVAKITQKKRDRYISNKENSIQYAPSFLTMLEKSTPKNSNISTITKPSHIDLDLTEDKNKLILH